MVYIKSPYPSVPELPPLNVHTLLFERPPGNTIPRDFVVHIDALTGEERTYGQFVERVRDCATALAAPVHQGGLCIRHDNDTTEIIALFSPNCLDYMTLVHAALVVTIPFALIPSKPTMPELIYLLNKLKSGSNNIKIRLFTHSSLLGQAFSASKQVGLPTDCIYLIDSGKAGSKTLDIGSLIQNVKTKKLPRQSVVPAQKNTLAYLVFSSGTNGPPKAVMISQGNLCFTTMQSIIGRMEDSKYVPAPPAPPPPPRWLCFLPFYHSMALHFFILKAVLAPSTMVVLPRWNINQALAAISKYKISHLGLVPSIVHQLVNSPQTAKADLSSVRVVGCGAAYLSPDLSERFRKMLGHSATTQATGEEAAVAEGYGLSEATIGSITRPNPGQYGLQPDPKSTGILITGQEARIVREDGSDADYDEPGELLLKGGNVALGYWGDEEATRQAFLPDGWLRTGDRFRATKSGVLYYEDRLKDTLKVSGAQVAPAEIEQVLLSHPEGFVIDAVVAGVPGPTERDERVPRAWVVLSPAGSKLGEREVVKRLDSWVRESLSRYKWLTGGIATVNEIPKNPTGKVLRRVLVDEYMKEKEKAVRAKL
ncbi:acetyl-CoA synthetase-like protein [Fomitiporia mediterranea MF3/22]|uniref:acetyl-CoA synthetase-like protein n=1 Tax=Fomitiporia mediterranea (strain MF3/22) TaxID=694068 RepID=UPI0004407AC2|nr:acetyl-CoA synthetase-like protein [Fomitiporia mediterranea MF3/22]EJD06537.1 acetyl-CoA synthetase-like protein [Fomitiporia mediterranea MF3/22]